MQGLNHVTHGNSGAAGMSAVGQILGCGREYGDNKTASPRDKSTMDMAIDQLAAEISAAEMNFQSLGDKLNPVRSAGANICGDNKPSNGPNCELEERILQLAHRVSLLSGGIGIVTAQVCL